MMPKEPTFREALAASSLVILGIAITLLSIIGVVSVTRHEYGLGSLFLAIAAALAFAFFRKQKAGLVALGLIWVAVNAGVTCIAHPTILGVVVTVGAGVALVFVARWMAARSY
jgi:hypothetical protein